MCCRFSSFYLISIHALLTEGDENDRKTDCQQNISIHALLTEGDALLFLGEVLIDVFQSTPSSRRVTYLA